jgi:hypothetical protein
MLATLHFKIRQLFRIAAFWVSDKVGGQSNLSHLCPTFESFRLHILSSHFTNILKTLQILNLLHLNLKKTINFDKRVQFRYFKRWNTNKWDGFYFHSCINSIRIDSASQYKAYILFCVHVV